MFENIKSWSLEHPLIYALIVMPTLALIVWYGLGVIIWVTEKVAKKSKNKVDDFVVENFKTPIRLLFIVVLINLFLHSIVLPDLFANYLNISLKVAYAFVGILLALRFVDLGVYLISEQLDVNRPDNINARKALTQIMVFKRIVNSLIYVIGLSILLLSFDSARSVGISLLTSAGVMGIVLGLAAQKSISMILAGIQIAITQPIRLDDVVVVEGEWGRIEEITLTYVVVKIWDERRLILPVNYFLEHHFQNWTRNSAQILGMVFIYVDYSFDPNIIRNILPSLLNGNSNWDGRVANVQVTNNDERKVELRVLVSSADSSKNWDLRVELREKLLAYINQHHPAAFVKLRLDELP